ncbi:MAG TPA: amidase [Pyrinomonadaceae bacterium]|nr:amidase [Pyrinomonadaceae bacterium]
MLDDLVKLSAVKLAALMRGRKVSPVEVVDAYLQRIEVVNSSLNAVVTLAPDVLERALEAERVIMSGREVGALCGVPITVKDTIETEWMRTTSGSRMRADFVPRADAPAVARLKAAGAIVLCKTNVPEMAIPYECDNPVFGRTNNPHDLSRTSGGSSGGEAAAVSSCLSAVGLGSDLSGSIRVPAHFCGIGGLKPTPGRIASAGHFPLATGAFSLGAVLGPMARYVEDLSLLLKVLTEADAPKSLSTKALGNADDERARLRGLRVAVYLDESNAPVTSDTERALQAVMGVLKSAGLTIVEERPPGIARAIALWPALFSRESTLQLRDLYAGQPEKAGRLVSSVLASGESALPSAESTVAAWAERDALRSSLVEWMKETPLVISPVGSVPAFEHGARKVQVGERELSVFRAFGYARAANVLGLPAVSVPAGRSNDGLPIGVQITGGPFAEETVLAAASLVEEALGGWVPPKDVTGDDRFRV